MDKNAIKKYAVWAREQLIEKVTARAVKYQIVDGQELDGSLETINDEVLSETERKQRNALIQKIKTDGYVQVMEEVAYTWFNRFVAIRFMEVNGYLPSHVRVFSDENGAFKPQILAEAIHLDLPGLDMDKVMRYKEEAKEEDLFKYLLKVQCNALNAILPQMFQKIEDYTELLIPDYLLREGSVIEKLVNEIPEDNFDVNTENGQIEVIGWMYQYYISAKHEEVVDPLHGKVVKKEEIPAATQLFTTDWVVRYLIDNSVGRYWVERNPESKLADELTYFVKPKDGEIKTVNEKITPQDVTVFDPCVGSGHFLVYAFDVLMKIYVEYGFSERDAAAEIVKNNLFGLDIDGRAAQLAYFAVMMKARQYDRRFFTRSIQPNVYEITESNGVDRSSIEHFYESDINLKKDVEAILDTLKDAKEYGSILKMPDVDYGNLNERFAQIENEISMYKTYLIGEFKTFIRSAEIMSGKYAVVATNPPYLNKYDAKLKEFVFSRYNLFKGDLFSVFMVHNISCCITNGYCAFMTPNVWMFISSYEETRKYILSNCSISSLVQIAKGSFFKEATVDVCAFVIANNKGEKGMYFRLEDFKADMDSQKEAFLSGLSSIDSCKYNYYVDSLNFSQVPGCPIAYWIKSPWFHSYKNYPIMRNVCVLKKGTSTGDNKKFIRQWFEIDIKKAFFLAHNPDEALASHKKWFPINGGGERRKWYGNRVDVVNWENDGSEMKRLATELNNGGHWSRYIINPDRFFTEAIGWSAISSSRISVRYVGYGFAFSSAAMEAFESDLKYILALLNSVVAEDILQLLAPTVNFGVEQIGKIPYIKDKAYEVDSLAEECIKISKNDWDSFETSWDFNFHPFIKVDRNHAYDGGAFAVANTAQYYEESPKASCPIEASFLIWKGECDTRFHQLKENEEELNRIFIDSYGLKEKLKPEVKDKNVTVRLADLQRDIRSFISYAVGCMFGRYSLDVPGLVYAGGEWDAMKYKTFQADSDAIIPICDDEYFEDDIVGRFVKFVEAVYGKDTLEDNLKYIANALGGTGTSREVIRNYFINDFYADHVKVYQKKPIYWLFDSGKKNGFKCLIYMHRYQPDTIARIRTDYVHEQQARYCTAIEEIEKRIESASGSEKIKLEKKLNALRAQDDEIHSYEEKIHHLADQMISIDLDDGVKHNYELFKDVLAVIK